MNLSSTVTEGLQGLVHAVLQQMGLCIWKKKKKINPTCMKLALISLKSAKIATEEEAVPKTNKEEKSWKV